MRSQGKHKLAVEALHDIVKVYQGDSASWLELADIHMSLCDYQVTPSRGVCDTMKSTLVTCNASIYSPLLFATRKLFL